MPDLSEYVGFQTEDPTWEPDSEWCSRCGEKARPGEFLCSSCRDILGEQSP